MSNTKKVGRILSWNPKAQYGVIVCREGIRLMHYFLHFYQVEICEPEEIKLDNFVRFTIDQTRPPAGPNRYWCAAHAEVYESNPALTEAARALAGSTTLSSEVKS